MSVDYVGSRIPICDPKTGICNQTWYLFFQSLFKGTGLDNSDSGLIAPQVNADVLAAGFSASLADLSLAPLAPQQVFVPLDDVLPAFNGLLDRIAMLERAVNDLKVGGPVL